MAQLQTKRTMTSRKDKSQDEGGLINIAHSSKLSAELTTEVVRARNSTDENSDFAPSFGCSRVRLTSLARREK
jgi:hypothetical protein